MTKATTIKIIRVLMMMMKAKTTQLMHSCTVVYRLNLNVLN